MKASTRRALGALGIIVFAVVYIAIAATVADYVPQNAWAQLIYFLLVGTLWGVPLFPLLRWAGKPDAKDRTDAV
jgi:hypothetical protein